MLVTVIEHKDNTREILYAADHNHHRTNVRKYFFKDLPPETVEEIKKASADKVQDILAKL